MEKYKEQKWSGQKGKKFGHAGRQEDPYQPEEGQEAAICTHCQALYQGKRWFFEPKLSASLAGTAKVKEVLCPTCRKIKDHFPEGVLTLSGEFWAQHKDEIAKLLTKEAGRIAKRSVADRIIQTVTEGDKLVVETTTEKMAQHLGRAVYKAYKGDLNFRWGEMERFVRVYWSR